MDHESMELVLSQFDQADIFEKKYPYYKIIEVASNNDPEVVSEDSERLLDFIGGVLDPHDAIVPSGEAQAKQIWDLRENIANANISYGYCLKYDISLKSQDFDRIVQETR